VHNTGGRGLGVGYLGEGQRGGCAVAVVGDLHGQFDDLMHM
jgi:hypothetical protein